MSAQPSIFEFMAKNICHPTFALLWEYDPKTKRLTKPHVTFTPKFPGDGFNHDVRLESSIPQGYAIVCPCGNIVLLKDSSTQDAELAVCPRCLSWHTVIFK